MAETVGQSTDIEIAEAEEEVYAGPAWTSVFLMLAAAVICWGISLAFPTEYPLAPAESLDNWQAFGGRILGDILKALSLVALAIAISAIVPQVGLWFERIIFGSRRRLFLAVSMLVAVLSSGSFSYFVLGQIPHIQDEVAMFFQAQVLAEGKLYADTPELADFFDCEFIVVDGPRWYGKYFIGPSLVLVLGVLMGAPWLIHPLLASMAVLLVYALGRALFGEKIARVAAVLMVISPFRVATFSMMMAHPSCLLAMGLFCLGVIKVVQDPRRAGWSFIAGAALGFAVNTRPLTALAMGAVTGLMALYALPWRRFRWWTLATFILPLAGFALLFLGYNKTLTGDPFLTPFEKWSAADHLGFGPDVGLEYWRSEEKGHSLENAILRNGYFNLDALGVNLTGWGRVALLLLVLPLFNTRWPKRTWALAGVVGSLIIAYSFYHTHSVLAGQARYWSESMPMMLLLLAIALAGVRRSLPRLCRWLGIWPAVRTGRAACWLAGAFLVLWSIQAAYVPLVNECRIGYWGQGSQLRVLTREQGLNNALVFIPSPHFRAQARHMRWDVYGSGFALNAPSLQGPVIYARDLGAERNAELIAQYPGRKVYWIDLEGGDLTGFIPVGSSTSGKEP